ncbi:uncharacterized protein BJX67DRAFT_365714 [Aspergillus lucknowensis]|uniref:Urease accessory protein UreD n=1 Tax=Aspergillus lucknowensis TaxID=176173 RepID=A0ABR4LE06_9EURO
MPHKHKRRQNDNSIYDLPPTLIAKSLPVRDPSKPEKAKGKGKGKGSSKTSTKQNSNAAVRNKSALDDDTPRAFRRLMLLQERNQIGGKSNKKRKRDGDGDDYSDGSRSESDTPVITQKSTNKKKAPARTTTTTSTNQEPREKTAAPLAPKILPGEKLSDFAARVDREMPLSQMKRSNNPSKPNDLPKIKDHRSTKHEKHLRRLQAQWREDDARIKEREALEREEREEEMEEQLRLWKEWEIESGKRKRNRNAPAGKRKSGDGADNDDGPDPWAKLKKKRSAVNPFDVAQAPPQLKKPREVFKVRGGAKVDVANVPSSVGSLRRREELANERRNIVEEYRRLMAEKRQS